MTIVPAYGRDYKSRAALLKDWEEFKDFLVWPEDRYINKQDAENQGILYLSVRYKNNKVQCILQKVKGKWEIK